MIVAGQESCQLLTWHDSCRARIMPILLCLVNANRNANDSHSHLELVSIGINTYGLPTYGRAPSHREGAQMLIVTRMILIRIES